jgi:hypothetical protein
MNAERQTKGEVLKECAALADRLQPLAFIVLTKIQSVPKEERKRWGAYASSRVEFGVSPNRFSGGTPEIARAEGGGAPSPLQACAPQTPSVHNALKSCILDLALTEELSPNGHLSFASGISLPPKHQGERFSRKHTCYGTIC